MLKSLLVVVVSFSPETPNFGTLGGVAHPLEELLHFIKCSLLKCVYAHI